VAEHESAIANINLILEDIRRIAEHVSDLADAAMNQTKWEVIEKHGFKDKSASSGKRTSWSCPMRSYSSGYIARPISILITDTYVDHLSFAEMRSDHLIISERIY
jgi:hypothetical protein